MRFLKLILLFTALLFTNQLVDAQSVGIGTDNPDPNSIMDIVSTEKGILIPRMTTAQRNSSLGSLTATQRGLMIYNTTDNLFNYWDGSAWIDFPNVGGDIDWLETGLSTAPDDFNDNIATDGNVTIGGNTLANAKLDVFDGPNSLEQLIRFYKVSQIQSSGLYNTLIMSNTSGSITGTGIRNVVSGTGNGSHYALNNALVASGSGEKVGVYNFTTSSTGPGIRRGIYNSLNASNNETYGVQNEISSVSANVYGLQNTIDGNGSSSRYGVQNTFSSNTSNTTTSIGLESIFNGNNGRYIGAQNFFNATIANANGAVGFQSYFRATTGGQNVGLGNYFNAIGGSTTKIGVINGFSSGNSGDKTGMLNSFSNNQSQQIGVVNNYSSVGFSSTISIKTGFQNNFSNRTDGILTGLENNFEISQLGSGVKTGLKNEFIGASTTDVGTLYGVRNEFNAGGNFDRYGIYNFISSNSSILGNQIYGVYSEITGSGHADTYGIYSEITGSGLADTYGIYSEALHPYAYAGYFLGRVSIGNTATNSYVLPQSDGSANQVLTTDGSGVTNWQTIPNQSLIIDADGDTKIDVEESTDEDRIRFDLAGEENVVIENNANGVFKLGMVNNNLNILIGDDAGNGLTTGGRNIIIGAGSAGSTISTGGDNVFIGTYTAQNVTTGFSNLFIGSSSGRNNTSGNSNVFLGNSSGRDNTTGINNVFIGAGSGIASTTANENTFIGSESGTANSTGVQNTFVGRLAGRNNTTGASNCFYGYESGRRNSIGVENSFFGHSAGWNTTTGDGNSFFGFEAGYSLITGGFNSFFGYGTGRSTTTGLLNNFYGGFAGYNNTTGSNNSFFGLNSGSRNTTGLRNTYYGNNAGQNNEVGNDNVALGYMAGRGTLGSSKSGSISIGYQAGMNSNVSNRLYIENSSSTQPLVYGNFSTNEMGVNWPSTTALPNTLSVNGNASKTTTGAWLANSDERLKKNIKPLNSQQILEKVLQMRGVTYEWNDDQTGIERPKEKQYGFIAQELEKIWPTKVSEDDNGYLQTAYGDYDAMFVEAFKAQQELINKQQQHLEKLEQDNKELKYKLEEIITLLQTE